MRNDQHGDKSSGGGHANKDRQILINWMRKEIKETTGYTVGELKKGRNEIKLYRFGLFLFTTTNKAICEALDIPTEAGTRYKRKLEKAGKLKASTKKRICPYTKHPAKFLSTAENQYNDLLR